MRLVRNSLVICKLSCIKLSINPLNLSAQVSVSSFDAFRPKQYTARCDGHWDRAAVDYLVRGALTHCPLFLFYDEKHVRNNH